MKSPEWFQRWFGEEYKRLYPHRDAEQARAQAAALHAAVVTSDPEYAFDAILDIGCGAGRHLAALETRMPKRGVLAGIDLSAVLLRDARAAGHAVSRADMRRLPFGDGRFDLVASFFTSFGYFADAAEDAATLHEFARVTRPGGFLFLDLPNKTVVMRDLVPVDEAQLPGRRVGITRALEDGVVVKRIRIERTDAPAPESGAAPVEHHEERVRLYDFAEIEPVLAAARLEVVSILGDEHGATFDAARSPRMSLLLRKGSGSRS